MSLEWLFQLRINITWQGLCIIKIDCSVHSEYNKRYLLILICCPETWAFSCPNHSLFGRALSSHFFGVMMSNPVDRRDEITNGDICSFQVPIFCFFRLSRLLYHKSRPREIHSSNDDSTYIFIDWHAFVLHPKIPYYGPELEFETFLHWNEINLALLRRRRFNKRQRKKEMGRYKDVSATRYNSIPWLGCRKHRKAKTVVLLHIPDKKIITQEDMTL